METVNKLDKLLNLNVNDFTDKKGGFTYLSWATAWKEFIKVYPGAIYEIKKNDKGMPLFGDNKIGYMCYTTVTANDLTHEMWMPVLDFKNKAMLTPNMFDVNKSVMRCLTKNLAMFGLGLYIYAGEDLPVEPDKPDPKSLYSDASDEIVRKYIGSGKMLDNQRADLIKELDSGRLIACQNLCESLLKEYGSLNA